MKLKELIKELEVLDPELETFMARDLDPVSFLPRLSVVLSRVDDNAIPATSEQKSFEKIILGLDKEYKLGDVVYTIVLTSSDLKQVTLSNLEFKIHRHIITGIEQRLRENVEIFYELGEGKQVLANKIYPSEESAKTALVDYVNTLLEETETRWYLPSNNNVPYEK